MNQRGIILLLTICSVQTSAGELDNGSQLESIFNFVEKFGDSRINEVVNLTSIKNLKEPGPTANVTFTKFPVDFIELKVAEIKCLVEEKFNMIFRATGGVNAEGIIKYVEDGVTYGVGFNISFRLEGHFEIVKNPFSSYFDCVDDVVFFELLGWRPVIKHETKLMQTVIIQVCNMLVITFNQYDIGNKVMVIAQDCFTRIEEKSLNLQFKREEDDNIRSDMTALSLENKPQLQVFYETKEFSTVFRLRFQNGTLQKNTKLWEIIDFDITAQLNLEFGDLGISLKLDEEEKTIEELESILYDGISSSVLCMMPTCT